MQGYAVLGGEATLMRLIDDSAVDVVVIGCRHLDRARLARIEEACRIGEVQLLRFSFQIETLVSTA